MLKSLISRGLASCGLCLKKIENQETDAFAAQRRIASGDELVIFDVGANVGKTVIRYRELFPQAVIHAFEPFPETFEVLNEAVGLDTKTFCQPVALSDEVGETIIHSNAGKDTNSLLPVEDDAAERWGSEDLKTIGEEVIQQVTLDQFCKTEGIARIDVLKLDVQGAEYKILEGAKEMLEQGKIGLIYFELIMEPSYQGQRKPHEYFALLDSHGFRIVDFFGKEKRNGELFQMDVLGQMVGWKSIK